MSKHRPKPNPGHTANTAHPSIQPVSASHHPTEPPGLKRRHFMGTALALDAAALLAACGGGGGGGDSGGTGMSGSGSGSGSGSASGSSSASSSSSGSSSASSSSSASGSGSSSGSGSGSGSPAPTNWVVTTFAGTGASSPVTDGTGGTATFNYPTSVTLDASGIVYVADTLNHCIRKISSAGVVTTWAGVAGTSGHVDGAGVTARFKSPQGIIIDNDGSLIVADKLNHLIRKISPAGVVTTLAGSGVTGFADGISASFNNPSGVAVDTAGNVYVADQNNHLIRKISTSGLVVTIAGTRATGAVNGTGTMASFQYPSSVAVDTSGNVYVADCNNHMIRKISSMGVVSIFAGISELKGFADGSGATAQFNLPYGVAIDNVGNVYVADSTNLRIRQISPVGVVSTLAGSVDRPDLSFVSSYQDGTGNTATFSNPSGVAVDNSGHVYVADSINNRIRKITRIY